MKHGGALRRRRLARSAELARAHGLAPDRAERFRLRQAETTPPSAPPLDELAQWPAWPLHDEDTRRRVFAVAALLESRDALEALVCGARLRGYAAMVGEEVFERLLDRSEAGAAPLPPVDRIDHHGRMIAAQGLPARLAALAPPDAEAGKGTADRSRRRIEEAEMLLLATGQL